MTERSLEVGFAGAAGSDRPHLSVDGMTPVGPNLSHWPGNRTPARWKRDLSTGICLAFAADEAHLQKEFLGDVELVLNDHYDTDGFLSLLAITRPEIALAREEICLAAAATGDYGSWQSSRAFAIDRIVLGLDRPHSPLAGEFGGLEGPERELAKYRWLLAHAEQVLDHPETLEPLWRGQHDAIRNEISAARSGAVRCEHLAAAALGVVSSQGPLHRMTLNTVAASWRVLHVESVTDSNQPGSPHRYRYHDRTESWFELATFTPPARRDLRPLAADLQELEGCPGPFGWHADPPDTPIPELWFGLDEPQAYGEITRTLGGSQLPVDVVVDRFTSYLRLG